MMLPTISVAPSTSKQRRGDVDVADRHRADDRRPDGRQREDDRHLDLAGQHVGQHHALVGDERVQRVRHRVLHDHRALGEALGARGLDVLRVQRVEQVAAHHPHVVGEPAERRDEDHRPDVLDEVDELAPAPGRAAVLRRVEAADLLHVQLEGEHVEDDQRQQEARDRHPEERDERERGVDPAVLPGRGEDAEADAEDRGEQVAGQRQRDRARQPLADHLGHRPVVEVGPAEVAAGDDAADPAEVLHDQRVVQPVLLAVALGGGVGGGEARVALGDHVVADVVAVVAGRRVDDHEGDQAHHEQHRNRLKHPDEQESDHRWDLAWSGVAPEGARPGGRAAAARWPPQPWPSTRPDRRRPARRAGCRGAARRRSAGPRRPRPARG